MKMYRQGDVLLVTVDSMPENAQDVTESDRIVLAYGEVTGHAHALYEPQTEETPHGKARLLDTGFERFLKVLEPTQLKHEEHTAIDLAPGVYRVIQQREYTDEEARWVED